MATRHRFALGGKIRTVEVAERDGGMLSVRVDDGEPITVDATTSGVPGLVSLIVDGRPNRAYVTRRSGGYLVTVEGRTFNLAPASGAARQRGAVGGAEDPPGKISAPLAGVVVDIRVAVGDRIEPRQAVVVVEAMKMQNEVQSPRAGTVTAIHCEQGGRAEKGDLLVEYDPDPED